MNKYITQKQTEKFIFPKINNKETIRVRIWNNTTTVNFDFGTKTDKVHFVQNGVGKKSYYKVIRELQYNESCVGDLAHITEDIEKIQSFTKLDTLFNQMTGQHLS